LVARILDCGIEIFFIGARCTAQSDMKLFGAKLRGGNGQAAIFLVGNFARMSFCQIRALATKSGHWIAAIASCKLTLERLDNDC